VRAAGAVECAETGEKMYSAIDSLREARTVAGLVRRLKPILNELAYRAATGESAVMEARETWHRQYEEALYGEIRDGASQQQ
jgi:hypothetical protein